MIVTDWLLVAVILQLALGAVVLHMSTTRILRAIQAETAPQWTVLPKGVTVPATHCPHPEPAYAVHGTGVTICQACYQSGACRS